MHKSLIIVSLIFIFSCEQNMEINESNNPGIDHSQDITRGLKVHSDLDGNLIEESPILENYEPLNSVHLFLAQSRIQIQMIDFIGADESRLFDYGDFGKVHFNNKEVIRFDNVPFYEFSWGNEGLIDIPNYDESQKMGFQITDSPHYKNSSKVLTHSIEEYNQTSLKISADKNSDVYEFKRDIDLEFNKKLSIQNSYIQVSFYFVDKDESDPTANNYYDSHLFLIPTEELTEYTISKETTLELLKSSVKQLEKNLLRHTGRSRSFKNIMMKRMYFHFTTQNLEYDKINVTRKGNLKNYDIPIYMFEGDKRSYVSNDFEIDLTD